MFNPILKKTNATIPPSWFPKFMFVGDSTVADSSYATDRSGWKTLFCQMVYNEFGYLPNSDFVLGSNSGAASEDSYSFCGASGMRSDQIYATYSGNGADSLQAATHAPDFVIIEIGLNDIFQNYNSSASAPHTHVVTYINNIVNAFFTAKSNATIFLCNMTDNSSDSLTTLSANSYILTSLQNHENYSSSPAIGKVSVIDIRTALGAYPSSNYQDTKHASNNGNILIAQLLFDSFNSAFSDFILSSR